MPSCPVLKPGPRAGHRSGSLPSLPASRGFHLFVGRSEGQQHGSLVPRCPLQLGAARCSCTWVVRGPGERLCTSLLCAPPCSPWQQVPLGSRAASGLAFPLSDAAFSCSEVDAYSACLDPLSCCSSRFLSCVEAVEFKVLLSGPSTALHPVWPRHSLCPACMDRLPHPHPAPRPA